MDTNTVQQRVDSLDRRVGRMEQILPTLATKNDLEAAIEPLATRTELQAAIELLATRAELQAAMLATRTELQAAIEPLATRAELRATREEFRAAITEAEQRTRTHFDVVAESLRDDIRLIAEGFAALSQRME